MAIAARNLGRGEKSRRELTSIATDCFARYGYQGSSVERIARMAGVTKGAIYYHFRDKEDLLAAAVNDAVRRVEAANRDKMSQFAGLQLPEGFQMPF